MHFCKLWLIEKVNPWINLLLLRIKKGHLTKLRMPKVFCFEMGFDWASGWPQTGDPSPLASDVRVLQACNAMLTLVVQEFIETLSHLFYFTFVARKPRRPRVPVKKLTGRLEAQANVFSTFLISFLNLPL